jgi:hypothetical protein
MRHTNTKNQTELVTPIAAWHWFNKCQKIADDLGYGGHWARVATTGHKVDLSELMEKFPEFPVEPLVKYLSEGVYWLRSMLFTLETPANGFNTSRCAEHAIACFGYALDAWALQKEED